MNCETHGHASWARTCPSFHQQCGLMAQRDPVATYRFFPSVDEPWTWDQIERPPQPEDIEPENAPEGWATVTRQHHTGQGRTSRQNYTTPAATGRAAPRTTRPGTGTNPPVGNRDRRWPNKPVAQANLDSWIQSQPSGTQESLHDSNNTPLA